jgi:hypothetical protein
VEHYLLSDVLFHKNKYYFNIRTTEDVEDYLFNPLTRTFIKFFFFPSYLFIAIHICIYVLFL